MTRIILISEPYKQLAEQRLTEIVRLYGAVSFTRILFKGNRYFVKVKIECKFGV